VERRPSSAADLPRERGGRRSTTFSRGLELRWRWKSRPSTKKDTASQTHAPFIHLMTRVVDRLTHIVDWMISALDFMTFVLDWMISALDFMTFVLDWMTSALDLMIPVLDRKTSALDLMIPDLDWITRVLD